MKKLLKYEYIYLFKTKKFLIFAALFVLFSILSPLTARYLQEIIGFLVDDLDLGNLLPDPTIYSAYVQYTSDLYEMVFTITMFVAVSVFIKDKTKGLRPLIYSKPINKTKYVLSKFIAFISIIFAGAFIGYIVFTYYIYFLFDEVLFAEGIFMMIVYYLDLVLASALCLFAAAYFANYVGAIVIAWVGYIAITLLSLIERIEFLKYFPGATRSYINGFIFDTNKTGDVLLNVMVTVLIIVLLVGLSIHRIRNEEI